MTDTPTQDTCCRQTDAAECSNESTNFRPQFDIQETDDELVLYGDLPGVLADDLEIRLENRELTIHGKVASRQPAGEALQSEYGVGDFHRSFSVSETINPDAIAAELKNGVLTLHLPKAEAVKPRRIKVEC